MKANIKKLAENIKPQKSHLIFVYIFKFLYFFIQSIYNLYHYCNVMFKTEKMF